MVQYRIKTVGTRNGVPALFVVRRKTLLNDTVAFRAKSLADCVKFIRDCQATELQEIADEWANNEKHEKASRMVRDLGQERELFRWQSTESDKPD